MKSIVRESGMESSLTAYLESFKDNYDFPFFMINYDHDNRNFMKIMLEKQKAIK